MKAFQLTISGNWAHFRKVETNNNPLTHDFITKTALVGLIGAVLGYEREKMRSLFPVLCEDLLYGVQAGNITKVSYGFTMRNAINLNKHSPKSLELLKKPKYKISLALRNTRSLEIFENFMRAIKMEETFFTPVLGLHNCPANLAFSTEGYFSDKKNGDFESKGFISNKHKLLLDHKKTFRIGVEKIPTFQNNDFWNIPEKYVDVIYPAENCSLNVEGEFWKYSNKGEQWWLV